MNAAEIVAHVDHYAAEFIADALAEATADYWHRRAETFEWVKPRLDDFHGQATHAELSAQWRAADEIARACRARARMALVERWDERAACCSLSAEDEDELARLHRAFTAVSESLGAVA